MSKYKRIIKLFLIGEEDKECEWLSQMSRNGYHLVNVRFGVHYTFEKGDAREYAYVLDMKENNTSYVENT